MIIIRILAFLFPLLLISLTLYICEREFYRLLDTYDVELPSRLLPCPEPPIDLSDPKASTVNH